MFFEIDMWLVDKFERFSHKFQRFFGYDCFWLARSCYYSCVAFLALFLLGAFWYDSAFHLLALLIIILPAYYIFIPMVEDAEALAKKMRNKNLANPKKLDDASDRIKIFPVVFVMVGIYYPFVFAFLVPKSPFFVNFFGIYVFCGIWCLFLTYFIACDPLPPAKSKIRQWLEKLAEAAKGIFEPIPEPVPIPVRAHR